MEKQEKCWRRRKMSFFEWVFGDYYYSKLKSWVRCLKKGEKQK